MDGSGTCHWPGGPGPFDIRSVRALVLRSASCYIATQERHERPAQRGDRIQRRDPGRADDRRPVGGLAEQALPRVELRAEKVWAQPVQRVDDREELRDERED